MKILCHVGPWCDEYFLTIAKEINKDADVTLISGHKKIDQSGLAARYYALLDSEASVCEPTAAEVDRVKRCRLLRSLDIAEALRHLRAMQAAAGEILDKLKPDLVLSETIDSFVMDAIYAECGLRDIQFLGLVPSFVNGYFRVTARGEHNCLRQPDADEIRSVVAMLDKEAYVPSFLEQSKKSPHLSVIKRWARNAIKPPYFAMKRVLSGEKYNYHYWSTQIVARQWFHWFPRLWLGDERWRDRLRAASKPVIYVPLQMIPEATVDYWCDELSAAIEYESTLLGLIERLSPHFHFLLKEHPNVLGFRNPSIYRALASMDSVTICPTHVNSNSLVDAYDAMLVWTGTAGFEAAIRGKPVLALCRAYYMTGPRFKVIGEDSDAREIAEFISATAGKPTEEEKRDVVAHLLSGLLRGRLKCDGTWRADSHADAQAAVELARSLATHAVVPAASR